MNLLFLTHQTVIYQFDAKDNNIDNWISEHQNYQFSSCGGIPYFYSSDQNINQLYLNLEPHSHIQVDAEIIIFENGFNTFYLDLQQENYQIEKQSQYSFTCGVSIIQLVYSISISLLHNRRSLSMRIQYSNFGLIKLSLSTKCEYHCAECFNKYQGQCLSWKLHQQSFNQQAIPANSDGWSYSLIYQQFWDCGECQFLEFNLITYSVILPSHQDILIRFFRIRNSLYLDYTYDYTIINSGYGQVDILIKNHPDFLFQLEIRPHIFGSIGFIRDFEIFYSQQAIIIIHNVILNCLDQVGDQCINCQEGWIQDDSLQNCHPICGDGIIQGQEQCDDANQLSNDGCFQCRFSCPFFCQQCEFGKCLRFQSNQEVIDNRCYELNNIIGLEPSLHELQNSISNLLVYGCYGQVEYQLLLEYQLTHEWPKPIYTLNQPLQIHDIYRYYFKRKTIENCLFSQFDQCLECQMFYKPSQNKNKCIPKCDDGIIIENEICDDLNNIQFDGCYKCQLSCQLECNQCIQQQCYSCIDGWQLIDQKCYQICGDGLLAISSLEQCDDGNYQPNDGCYNCNFECNSYCFQCDSSNNCLLCVENFDLTEKNQCKPICGDGIIIQELEECEDLNDIQFDGCHQCFFQCNQNCSKCVQGMCQQCTEGYDLIINECQKALIDESGENDEFNVIKVEKCGDAYQSTFEQCDDGNQDNGDGCSSKCMLEENWSCNQDQPNYCFLQTKYSLEYENQTFQHQFVLLKFSNEVKQVSNLNFTQSIQPVIINLNQSQYQISINPVVGVDSAYFTMALFEFDIVIFEQMSLEPNFSISFNSSLVDNNNMLVGLPSQQLLLKTPKVINQKQITIANKCQDIGNVLIIGLGAISILLLLFRQPFQCLEIFDLLQFQSYLKFVNISYPQNLQIYFQSSEIVTVSPILIYFKITDLLNNLITENFIPSIGKFQEFQTNADLLLNIQSQIFQIFFIGLLYVFLQFYPKITLNYAFTFRTVYFIREKQLQWLNQLIIKLYQIHTNILKLKKIYSSKGFIQLFYANCWDLFFKVFLFMISNTETGYRSKTSYGICFLVLGVTIIILLLNFKGMNENLKVSNLRFQQFESITLLKKLLFILILTVQQSSGIIQCVMLTLLSLGYIGLLLLIKQNIERIELIGIIWTEVPVMFFTLTSLIYCSDFSTIMKYNEQILIGFVQILILIFGLLGPVIKLGISLYKDIKLFYEQKKQKKKLKIHKMMLFI
ncbi:unnamed protein product [Paramecium octaurelia]|uniref:Insulin-like growth factor binding protein, N-terminal n=1 Tax=Paramecium octaurelia TaxID=43137 RepID=A0A8S1W6Q4_PAROT|nr:unnamed protein product [Paramecium octaurelia]